jgi:hypothetical protein
MMKADHAHGLVRVIFPWTRAILTSLHTKLDEPMTLSVAEWCKQRNLDAHALSEATGLDSSRIDSIMQGRWTPSPSERSRIAAALGVSVDEITWGHATPIQHLYGHGPG